MTLSPTEMQYVLQTLTLASDAQLRHVVEWIIAPMVTPKGEDE